MTLYDAVNMSKVGINSGIILITLGILGYFAGGMVSWTALIPAIFGLLILIPSLIARNPDKLKLGMHIAATFGLLGFFAPLGRIIPTAAKGEFVFNLATASMIGMLVVCGIFLVLCIKSFKEARQNKASGN